ncbi:MAG: HIT domain-containing protein [Phycisphaerae bacterium]
MAEANKNLWAPWRMEYIRSLSDEVQARGCFLCRYWGHPDADAENHVVSRGRETFVVMNRFPYTNGHLMVATAHHDGGLSSLSSEAFTEMMEMIRDAVGLLERVVKAQGFNIGFNVGLCAGAGLPDHLHAHIVPRWSGDTNYMAVLGDVRVVPDSLDALYKELVAAAKS